MKYTIEQKLKRILVIRSDRIGEVLLSTPVLSALKARYPQCHITMMANPISAGIIKGNPYLNQILKYSDELSGWKQIMSLKRLFRRYNFDAVFILNPKKEFHIASFLARIPIRVGYRRKLGFLLTHTIPDRKHLGLKHEVEYNLDLIRRIGIEPRDIDKRPFVAIRREDRRAIKNILQNNDLSNTDIIVSLHPSTTNPLKKWPEDNFAKLGDMIIQKGSKVVLIGGNEKEYLECSNTVSSKMKNKPINLTGKISLKQLGAFFKVCRLLISCDSGPVHIADAVGTTVCVLFGQSDPGSNPVRWGPYGNNHIILQKNRIETISPEEVFKKIEKFLIR